MISHSFICTPFVYFFIDFIKENGGEGGIRTHPQSMFLCIYNVLCCLFSFICNPFVNHLPNEMNLSIKITEKSRVKTSRKETMKQIWIRAYIGGFLLNSALRSLFEDYLGQSGLIESIKANWVSGSITIPLAILVGCLAFYLVCSARDLERNVFNAFRTLTDRILTDGRIKTASKIGPGPNF